jgi:hypothetical protein
VTAEAIMTGLRRAGWSLGERATDLGHVAEADRGVHRIAVSAPTSAIAWLACVGEADRADEGDAVTARRTHLSSNLLYGWPPPTG